MNLDDCFNVRTLAESSVTLLNQLIFRPAKAYVNVNGNYYDFGARIHNKIRDIENKLRSGTYTFQPYRQITLKRHDKVRLVYLAAWPDKIVEKWLAEALSMLFHDQMSMRSFAYRTGKFGLDFCQFKVSRLTKHNSFIVRRDISQFFYSIPQGKMLAVLAQHIPTDDYLYKYLEQRIFNFPYDGGNVSLGIPFGSSLACVLANLYLTSLDKLMEKHNIAYFRYADDFLMLSKCKENALKASEELDNHIVELGLSIKPSHKQELTFTQPCDKFKLVKHFSFLGLTYDAHGSVRLNVEKQRKLVNLFKRMLRLNKGKIERTGKAKRLQFIIDLINDTFIARIRSAAIIDYYLKHVNDDHQLKQLDMIIAQLVISTYNKKKFRYRDFSKLPYGKLRQMGLPSLVHRRHLLSQGHLKINFLDLHNKLVAKRHEESIKNKQSRINSIKMAKLQKKVNLPDE